MLLDVNGEIVEKGNAEISIFDRGFLYGDGIFETLRAVDGEIIEIDAHIDRLQSSAELTGMELSAELEPPALKKRLDELLEANSLSQALVRITVTGGRDIRGKLWKRNENLTSVIIPKLFEGYSPETYHTGKKVHTSSVRRNHPDTLNPEIKSCNYLNNILALREANEHGCDEAFMLNVDGYLTEGTVCNVFWYKNGTLFTPSAETGLLKGITREKIIELSKEKGYPVREVFAVPEDLYEADEIFITNTSSGVMPVTRYDGKTICEGYQGEVSAELLKAFNDYYGIELPGK